MNPYLQVALNGLFTALGVALGTWLYNTYLKNTLNKSHKKIKRVFK